MAMAKTAAKAAAKAVGKGAAKKAAPKAAAKAGAKATMRKGAKSTAKGSTKKMGVKPASAAVGAPVHTNAVGMRFDMGAGASVGSAAPARSSFIPGKAGSSAPWTGNASDAGDRVIGVSPYRPVKSAKVIRKVGSAVGATGIVGGMAVTAGQKQRTLVNTARKYSK